MARRSKYATYRDLDEAPMLKEIQDARKIEQLDALIAQMVDREYLVSKDWLAVKGRIAVVFETAMHFNHEYASQFASAIMRSGHAYCYAVATEKLKGVVRHWEVPATTKGLLAFSDECGLYNFALIPEDGTFIILCTVDDYLIVAGDRNFVNNACLGDIPAARETFKKFAFDDHLRGISDRYDEENR